jgi:hypothetical protein
VGERCDLFAAQARGSAPARPEADIIRLQRFTAAA